VAYIDVQRTGRLLAGTAAIAVTAATAIGLTERSADARSTVTGTPQPLVTVVRHGGLCISGTQCRSTFRITDATISGDGFKPRPLGVRERAGLLRSIEKLDRGYLRRHPFTGTCPIAYDGTESIYRFRGFQPALASCRHDLRGVEAVRLTERLLRTLQPR
jgi:hypothetical protein